jgi:hypothetical protein
MVLGVPKRTLIVAVALIGLIVLYGMGAENQPDGARSGGTESAASSAPCRVAVNADVLNVRALPNSRAAKVDTLRRGQEIEVDKVVQEGFRKLAADRWASNDFLTPIEGDCG